MHKQPEGNVVLGYCSDTTLMLDVDNQMEETVRDFAFSYTKHHRLGSVLIVKTSECGQLNLFGNRLASFAVIFGKCPLGWEEIQWHVTEARRLGMIERSFLRLRKFGYITIRVNDKNNRVPHPKIVGYYRNGDKTGIFRYLGFYSRCRKLGCKEEKQ
jgi:hypothetical protein